MKRPELLAPAGNMEKLKVAVHYGADAVYLGGREFGLRSFADNFSEEELRDAVAYAHDRGVKVYLTVNSYPSSSELDRLQGFLERVADIPLDAYIVADPGVLSLARDVSPLRPLHLSTQANTVNWRSASFWAAQGVSRINLARETTLEGIGTTREKVPVELEVFVHGAMCISYSGRCLLSSAMAGRNANKGECAHPCRWEYSLVEEKRPGEYFPIVEDERGTFIFNSRDLCLLPHLPEILAAGADSLKIEGRMKGVHYVASVVRVYRDALDRLLDDPQRFVCREEWMEELTRISHRGYTSGFLFGEPRDVGQEYRSRYIRTHDVVGVVTDISDGVATIGIRNRLHAGETVQFIGRNMRENFLKLEEMTDPEGNLLGVAHPNSTLRMKLPFGVERFDLMRREKG